MTQSQPSLTYKPKTFDEIVAYLRERGDSGRVGILSPTECSVVAIHLAEITKRELRVQKAYEQAQG